MTSPIVIENADAVRENLVQYAALSGKTIADAVVKANNEIRWQCYFAFRNVAPERNFATKLAKQRNYALDISQKAKDLASVLMGGRAMVMGSVAKGEGPYGTDLIRTVRIGKKGKRITGGRKARGGRAAESRDEALKFKMDHEHWLNRRAVQTFFEMMLRNRGRLSAAVSFMNKRYQKLSRVDQISTGDSKKIVFSNPKASVQLMGENEMTQREDEVEATIRYNFQSAGGLQKHRNLIQPAIRAAAADMKDYIRRKLTEQLAGRKIGMKEWSSGSWDAQRRLGQ